MAKHYQNIKTFLEEGGLYEVATSEQEFVARKLANPRNATFQYKCNNGHVLKLSIGAFNNKKIAVAYKDFCSMCKGKEELIDSLEEYKDKIRKICGHELLTMDNYPHCTYRCGNCSNVSETAIGNLLRQKDSKPRCIKCMNDEYKLEFSYIKSIVEAAGLTCLLKPEDYKDNKQKIPCLCKCGEPYQAVLSDIKRGKTCLDCKLDKCMVSSYSSKVYKFSSGREVLLQGYEPQAIDYILSTKNEYLDRIITEEEIIVGRAVPHFEYTKESGKIGKYRPDIHIKDTNLIIEIKSSHTYDKEYDKNYRKFTKVASTDYVLDVIIFYTEDKLFDIWHFSKEPPKSLRNLDIEKFDQPIGDVTRYPLRTITASKRRAFNKCFTPYDKIPEEYVEYKNESKSNYNVGKCICGTLICVTTKAIATKKFCRNTECTYYKKGKKLREIEICEIIKERGCIAENVPFGCKLSDEIEYTCSCGVEQKSSLRTFIADQTWCKNVLCEHYKRQSSIQTSYVIMALEHIGIKVADDFRYVGYDQRFEVVCNIGHKYDANIRQLRKDKKCTLCLKKK